MADRQKTIDGEGYIQYSGQAEPTRESWERDRGGDIQTIDLSPGKRGYLTDEEKEDIRRGKEKVEDRQSRDYWNEKNNARYELALEKKREAAREKEHAMQMELVKAGRQPASRTVVQNRFAPRRQSHPFNMGSIDFGSAMISSGLGGAESYSSPFSGMGLPGLDIRSMGLGTGMRQSAYTDPFRGMGIAMNRKSPLNMSSGVFARNAASTLLTEGIFSGKMPSLFGSPAPARRKTAAKKKPATKGKPALYGNAAAARKGHVQVNGKKVPVKRLPARKKR